MDRLSGMEAFARAVETAALRERLFRLEQRGVPTPFEEPTRAAMPVED